MHTVIRVHILSAQYVYPCHIQNNAGAVLLPAGTKLLSYKTDRKLRHNPVDKVHQDILCEGVYPNKCL